MDCDISVENARIISNLQKKDGRTRLGEVLGWEMESFDEDAQMRESILLDFLYDSLMFGVQKGFPWPEVCSLLHVAAEFQQRTVGEPLSSAIKIYREISQKHLGNKSLSDGNLRLFTSHMFETYMTHYQLYQIVFMAGREPMTVQQHLAVMPPPETYPLDEAQPLSTWEYKQRLTELETEEKIRLENLKLQQENILQEMGDDRPFTQGVESGALLGREQVSQLIEDAIKQHTTTTEKLLQTKLEEKHEDLSFYLEKTALPRPQQLGPPPRTKEPPRLSAKSRASGKLAADGKGMSAKSKKSKKSAKN